MKHLTFLMILVLFASIGLLYCEIVWRGIESGNRRR